MLVARYAVALLLGAFAIASHAADVPESLPARPLTLVVGFAPGGGIDIDPVFARALRRCVELIQQAGEAATSPVFTYQAQGAARG